MGERKQEESCRKWPGHETAVMLTEPLGPLLHSFQRPTCSTWPRTCVCVCSVTVTRTHLIVCRKRTLSLISSGILLRMCLRALAFSFRSWNSCSGRSIMNSAKQNKSSLAPRHKFKMCRARTRAHRQSGSTRLLRKRRQEKKQKCSTF